MNAVSRDKAKASMRNTVEPISEQEKQAWLDRELAADKRLDSNDANNANDDDEEDEDEDIDDHDFVPWKSTACKAMMNAAREWTRRKLLGAPLLILEKQLRIDDRNILIADDKIYLTSDVQDGKPLRINFASAWNETIPEDFIGEKTSIIAPRFLLPPIPFVAIPATENHGAGFRLMVDFFKNDWVLHSQERLTKALSREVPVPAYKEDYIHDEDLENASRGAFLQCIEGVYIGRSVISKESDDEFAANGRHSPM